MTQNFKRLMLAAATLTGLIIGVGIFGVPYAIGQLGWPLALLFFFVLGGVQLMLLLFLAEAAIATESQVRFPGLVQRHLGPRYKTLASVTWAASSWAAIIAYILIGGQFLHTLLAPTFGGSIVAYQLGWATVGFFVLSLSLNWVSRINLAGTLVLVATLFGLTGLCVSDIDLDGVSTHVTDVIMPYGVILFALSGLGAITEMEDEVGGDRKLFRRSIFVGYGAAWLLTLAFGFIVYGVTGAATTTDAVTGLQMAIGGPIPYLAAVCGFFAVATSFIIGGEDLKSVFEYDYKLKPYLAWLVTILVPAVLFIVGAREFMSVISFSAAVFGGVNAALVAMMYTRISRQKLLGDGAFGFPSWLAWFVGGSMAIGALVEIGSTVMGWVG